MSKLTPQNLVPFTGQLQAGQRLLRHKDGTFIPIGVGVGSGGSGNNSSMNFYKCASVDTSNSTWTGYLASVDSSTGVWSFAETATTGLSYASLTPVVGKVYDEACTFRVEGYKTGLPEDGLIFYLALAGEIGDTDDTGAYQLNKVNPNYSFGSKDGINCLTIGYAAKLFGPDLSSIFQNNSSTRFTISFWGAADDSQYSRTYCGFSANTSDYDNFGAGIAFSYETFWTLYGGNWMDNSGSSITGTQWAFNHLTYDGSTLYYYRNGTRLAYKSTSTPFGSYNTVYPGFGHNTDNGTSYLTAFRIYNRVLDNSELASLAAEFSPSAS